jgi:hypothetical protein
MASHTLEYKGLLVRTLPFKIQCYQKVTCDVLFAQTGATMHLDK